MPCGLVHCVSGQEVVRQIGGALLSAGARFVFRSVSGLATAIRGPRPPGVAHSTPLGLLYLGLHALFCRAAGSAVAPGFVVSPRPSGASFEGVCTQLGGFPVPRRLTHRRAHPLLPYELVPRRPSSVEPNCGQQSERRPAAMRRITWFAVFLAKIKSCRQDFSCLSTGLASRFGSPCSSLPFASPRCLAASPRGSNDIAACFRESRLTCS